MAKKEKTFPVKLYALVAFLAVAAVLVLIVTLTFKAKYTGYHPEEVARVYVDTVAQTGDGYNAYKNALPSVNDKYGDFIRKQYIYPLVYREARYQPGDKTDALTGFNDASYMGEKSQTDNGTLQGQVIDAMYPYYVELIANGWDDYDTIFAQYFAKLVEVRKEVFGDDYMTDEIIFTALESNVKTYGESLTGTEDVFDENSGEQLEFKSIGAYQTAYGEDYKFTTVVQAENEIALDAYKAGLDTDRLAVYGIAADEITAVKSFTVGVQTADGATVTDATVVVVKIGSTWYVDNTATDTAPLYNFYK
ncbi:MAG: hypothetical protein Q4E21_03305 [Clostridia bacterium]|nr:hypothetical protein [Clostridia bacterium]